MSVPVRLSTWAMQGDSPEETEHRYTPIKGICSHYNRLFIRSPLYFHWTYIGTEHFVHLLMSDTYSFDSLYALPV